MEPASAITRTRVGLGAQMAMAVLTRLLFGFISIEHGLDVRILIVTGGILLLASAVLVARFGSNRYPAEEVASGNAIGKPQTAET